VGNLALIKTPPTPKATGKPGCTVDFPGAYFNFPAPLRPALPFPASREKAEILLAGENSLTSNLLHIREIALAGLD
jgi:hypothetical protein